MAFLLHSLPGHKPVRISMFTGAESLLKGLLLCLSILPSSLATDILLVKYPKADLRKQEGEALNLNCNITYVQNMCEKFHAHWCKVHPNSSCTELTDARRQLIQVSEMHLDQVTRSRLITLSIEHLTLRDEGSFQCNAECGGNGLSARGNYIHLAIFKADPKRSPLQNCGIHRVEVIPIRLYFIFLFVFLCLC
ncbi:hypothetical protein SKAU_G00229430 [Synaphobranchus kaupii]|uniref:Ig-like domain-containing protein n=1 Tax=Synaphobranchus kaupii TaxID=118154 RepID=A0A9Q1F5A3_SYNKA|nr:hypothetical protein SKAU_G00229430 [Synaphobranchus kaupii]